jgi:hypothetical protein
MDKIQKILIQAGRKDLAQEYYRKVAEGKPVIPSKYYLVDIEDKRIVAGPFNSEEDGDAEADKRNIDLLSNDNDYAIWKGDSVLNHNFKIAAMPGKVAKTSKEGISVGDKVEFIENRHGETWKEYKSR